MKAPRGHAGRRVNVFGSDRGALAADVGVVARQRAGVGFGVEPPPGRGTVIKVLAFPFAL